jgi:queuine tRNA-ribosyltransferase
VKAEFDLESKDRDARAGTVRLANGSFKTPCFMPVGTRGSVRHLSSLDLKDLGAQVVLANTYHLMLKPGAEIIKNAGGIASFANWKGLTLTDSGGYQIFSLDPKIDEEGATFRSVYDGSFHKLTPESSADIQADIGADVQMVLDICPALPAPEETIRESVEMTAEWAERGRKTFIDHPEASLQQSQFGIVQGGVNPALRAESARRTLEIGFDGYAIGGLSVGEGRDEMLDSVSVVTDLIPKDQPRYFMGLGDPIGLVNVVERGVDMFDCVLPTRLARHGTVLTSEGRINIGNARFAKDDNPIDPGFPESPGNYWSRSYLRHLMATDEPTGARILTLHNLAWLFNFVERMRASIKENQFNNFRKETLDIWS